MDSRRAVLELERLFSSPSKRATLVLSVAMLLVCQARSDAQLSSAVGPTGVEKPTVADGAVDARSPHGPGPGGDAIPASNGEEMADGDATSGTGDPSSTMRISDEHPNGIAERVFFHYDDPGVALSSYAVADVEGCTGTMIGPNVLMTASHCTTRSRTATFYLYTDADTKLSESFNCEYLTHTFPDMDLLLYWVYPNAAGENAGDKYGYVDFDLVFREDVPWELDQIASRSKIALQTALYSTWTNPIDSIGGGGHAIYSEGEILETNTPNHWASPNLDNGAGYLCSNSWCVGGTRDGASCGHCPVDPGCPGGTCERRPSKNLGVTTDLWSNGGASGSAQLSVDNDRILSGPLSIGEADGPLRRSPAIVDYLAWGYTSRELTQPGGCRECDANQINESLLQQLDIPNPTDFYGWVDHNLDGMFDVQEIIELAQGENTRDWYWLGFESHRRNELWQVLLNVSDILFDVSYPLRGTAAVDTRGYVSTVYLPVLRHRLLNLEAGRNYRMAFRILLAAAPTANPVRLCLDTTGTRCHTFDPPLASTATYVIPFTATSDTMPQFEFTQDVVALLFDVSIIAEGAIADFDTFDKRETWRDENTFDRSLIWPNGPQSEGAGAVADWAGVVLRNDTAPLDDDWSLTNEQFALNGGDAYTICFQQCALAADPLTQANGRFVVTESGTGAVVAGTDTTFAPTGTWVQVCTSTFLMPSDGGTLKFGVGANSVLAGGGYLVDNIQVALQTPPGDACAEPIELYHGTSTGTTFGGHADGSSSCGTSDNSPDVWYHYLAPDDGVLQLDTCGSAYDTVLSVHALSCPGHSGTEIPGACNDDHLSNPACQVGPSCNDFTSCVSLDVTAGSEYLLRVSGYNGAYGPYALTARFVPSHDDCAAARNIGEGVFAFANYDATTDGPDESPACGAQGVQQIERDVWYRYTSSCDGMATADLCGSGFDTTMVVYEGGACPAQSSAASCSNDECGVQSLTSFSVTAGADYLIRIGGFNGATGAGTLAVSCFDDCNSNGIDDQVELATGSTIGYAPIDFSSQHNANMHADLDAGFPSGDVTLGGVPFVIPENGNNYWHSFAATGPNPRFIDISVDRFGVREAHTLINTYWGVPGPASYASLEFFGSDGAYYLKELVGNEDVRDFNDFVFTNQINNTTTRNVVAVGPHRLDKQQIELPVDFYDETLDRIRLSDNGGTDFQRVFLAGLTVLAEVPSRDCNADGRPDDCELPADANGDGAVTVADWSWVQACETAPCPAAGCAPAEYADACCARFDHDNDGDVDLKDCGEWVQVFSGGR